MGREAAAFLSFLLTTARELRDQMRDAGLHRGGRENRLDGLGKDLETIHHRDPVLRPGPGRRLRRHSTTSTPQALAEPWRRWSFSLDRSAALSYLVCEKIGVEMESFEDCIIFLLAKAYQRAHGILKDELRPFGLTTVQQLILALLEREDGLSAGEIGQKLVLDSATLSGILERMADNGWISKEADPNDRRVVRVFLTAKARELGPELRQARERSNQEILAGLSLEEKILVKRLLRDMR